MIPSGYTLQELVNLADSKGDFEDISDLIVALYKQNDDFALDLVIQLALCDYGGNTYKSEFQNLGIIGSLHWGIKGIKRLGEMAIENGGYRAQVNVSNLLIHISSKSLNEFYFGNSQLPSILLIDHRNEKYKTENWVTTAKEVLVELVKSIDEKEIFPVGIIQNLNHTKNTVAQEHLFASLIARWFNLNLNGLRNYIELVNSIGNSEIDYQNFLKSNSYILEPFHAQIWSKPRFGESLVPDFLIRSMDNSYTVVEIEQPDFPILTQRGELSSKATHAKRQALDFRNWAIDNKLYAAQKYKEIYRPFCLVVIGRESELNEMQIERLKQENESTQGILRIVGFDWLYNRAKANFDNLIKFGFERENFKEVIEGK